jgi:hypothetical protein
MQTAPKRELKEQRNRVIIREQIGHQLKKHYQACMTEELPPRLLALVKKLDEEIRGDYEEIRGD